MITDPCGPQKKGRMPPLRAEKRLSGNQGPRKELGRESEWQDRCHHIEVGGIVQGPKKKRAEKTGLKL